MAVMPRQDVFRLTDWLHGYLNNVFSFQIEVSDGLPPGEGMVFAGIFGAAPVFRFYSEDPNVDETSVKGVINGLTILDFQSRKELALCRRRGIDTSDLMKAWLQYGTDCARMRLPYGLLFRTGGRTYFRVVLGVPITHALRYFQEKM